MKNTSRRSFGEQLALAIVTFSVIAFSSIATFGQQTTTQSKPDKDCERKEHDTPPPTVLMSGSWIFEARTEQNHDWSTTTRTTTKDGRTAYSHYVPAYNGCGAAATKPIYIAHIKIVDGSGEMLYRFDNDDKNPEREIEIKTFMSADKREFVTLKTADRNFVLTFFENRKLMKEEPSMDPEPLLERKRQRALYKDSGGGNDPKIYGIEVVKDTYTVYGMKLYGYKALRELRIMVWWEELN